MKKKQLTDAFHLENSIEKLLLVMKLTFLLAVINILAVTANGYSQATRLSLNLKDATLKEVFSQIELQSSLSFLYKTEVVNPDEKVNITTQSATVSEVLDYLFSNKKIQYEILDNSLIVLLPLNESKQVQKVTGTVTDAATGEPLIGVNVVVEGTTIGVVTDAEGKFAIEVQNQSASLVFSYIGYLAEKVAISGQSVIEVKMASDITKLDEVVVVGYGTVKKKDLTGAVAKVGGDELTERQTTMLSQALQGTTAGVMVTRNNNAPGSTATIRIRGITTIGDNNPLIIVDGVPVTDINDINPNDVLDMSVLKDAASASIYGSRAAAGVILITTKRAKAGEISLTYNTEYGIEKPTKLPDYVDVKRYMQIANELRWNDKNNDANEYPLYAKDVIDNYDALNAENPNKYPDTDWVEYCLKDYAPRQSHLLNITAGTKSVRTKASIGYDKTSSLYNVSSSYERVTARFNNDITVNKFIMASIDLNFKRSISTKPYHDPMYNTLISAPVYAAEWADGRVAEGKTGANIYGMMKYGGYRNAWYNKVGGKMSLDITPIDGLKISAVISPSLGFDKSKTYNLKAPYYSADDPTVLAGYLEGCISTNLWENRNESKSITSQVLSNYMKSFGSHNFNAMAGYENYYAYYEDLGASREKYELMNYPYLNIGPLDLRGNSGAAYENAYRSWFGRILYNYKNKYYLQGNIRYDASSRFDEKYRWGSFPSFSAGWVISEENFMKDLAWLSFLKLRGSWGRLGNERIGNYPYQATIQFANALFYQGTNVTAAQTAAQVEYAIRDISWETTESIDFGLDANFFDNKLRLTGDYFEKITKDMLLYLNIPDFGGYDDPQQNTGKMNTKGWELEIGWNDKIGDFNYSVSANLSDAKSIMGDLGGTEFIGDQVKKKGSEFNEWYGYVSEGLFQTAEDLAASPKLNTNVKVGDVKYKDISGPDGIPDGKISPDYDRVLLGGSLPHYLYGGNIRMSYKNLDFSMVFQGIGQVKIRMGDAMVQPLVANWGNVPKILDGNSWSKYNTDEQNLAAKYPRYTETNKSVNYAMSDFWLMDGAYFRLKNITIGYNIPAKFTQKLKLQRVRVFVSGTDLFTADKFPAGWDPEVATSGYPITSSYLCGLSVTF